VKPWVALRVPPNWPGLARALALPSLLTASALAYCWGLGQPPLGASEAYSAFAAAQSSVALVARTALATDPGKPVLYHLILHWFCGVFGFGETALRAPSVIFGLLAVYLVFALGDDLFGFEVALAASVMWAFNPVAAVLARWARMYSVLVAAALGHLLAMQKVRRGAGRRWVLTAGVLGAAMLYVHVGGMLILGADLVVIMRERRRGQSRCWPPLIIATALFLPFAPLLIAQGRALLFGHWLDWLGARPMFSPPMVVPVLLIAIAALWVALGGREADDRREAFQQCLVYGFLPILALLLCSILVRPLFEIRYVCPSLAVLALVLAEGLDRGGARIRNLATAGLGAFFIALLPLVYGAPRDPWPAIAARVAASARPHEPIFFESGFFAAAGVAEGAGEGFPQGFFRVPFDYYFHRGNPRAAIPGAQSAAAQQIIKAAVLGAGGAWLVSARKWGEAKSELPAGPHLCVDYAGRFARISLFHIKSIKTH
jgi:mannosyltransferase